MSNNGDSKKYPQGPKQPAPETSPARIRAAREQSRLYLHTLADWLQGDFVNARFVEDEVNGLFDALQDRFSLTRDEAFAAREAEWTSANRAAVVRLNKLRATIRSLAWEGASLDTVIATVKAKADEISANFGNKQLEDLASRIHQPIAKTLAKRNRRP